MEKKINLFYVFIVLASVALAEGSYIFMSREKKLDAQTQQVSAKPLENSSNQTAAAVLSFSVATTSETKPVEMTESEKTKPKQKSIISKIKSVVVDSIIKPESNDKIAPTTPLIVSGKVISDTQINIAWATSTDNVAVTGYTVYRNDVKVGTTQSLKYAFVGLSPATLYSFSVSAYDAANNNSPKSKAFSLRTEPKKIPVATTTPVVTPDPVTPAPVTQTQTPDPVVPAAVVTPPPPAQQVVTPAPDITPPSAPTALIVTSVSPTQVDISWTASTDNVAVTNYKVYRNGTQIASINKTTYTDTGLTPGTSYNYTIYASDAADNISAQSGSLSVTTSAPVVSSATHTINIAPSGAITPSTIMINVGDTINFVYNNIVDESTLVFSPNPPASMKFDHENTQKSFKFTSAGTWTYSVTGTNTDKATIIVQ